MLAVRVTDREHTMLLVALRVAEQAPDVMAYNDAMEWLWDGEEDGAEPTNEEWAELAEKINMEYEDEEEQDNGGTD